MKIILLTGQPGTGKTTVVNRLGEYCSSEGLRVAGITTREVREAGVRVGFKITDLATGEEGWLAAKDSSTGPRVGSYRVVSKDLDAVDVKALKRAVDGPADIIIVDEIGPMEMTSKPFRESLQKVLTGDRATIATVKLGSEYLKVERIRGESLQIEITRDNRETIYQRLIEQVTVWVTRSEAEVY